MRELALEAAVNPNTMQKALSELERSGLVYSQRTSGRFITEDKSFTGHMKSELAKTHITISFTSMRQLGFAMKKSSDLSQEAIKRRQNNE